MSNPVHRRHRALGTTFLVGAAAMLILGQTLLKPQLAGLAFVFYWLVCFVLTGLAILTALIDARAVRQQGREQHRELLRDALKEVQGGDEEKTDPTD